MIHFERDLGEGVLRRRCDDSRCCLSVESQVGWEGAGERFPIPSLAFQSWGK